MEFKEWLQFDEKIAGFERRGTPFDYGQFWSNRPSLGLRAVYGTAQGFGGALTQSLHRNDPGWKKASYAGEVPSIKIRDNDRIYETDEVSLKVLDGDRSRRKTIDLLRRQILAAQSIQTLIQSGKIDSHTAKFEHRLTYDKDGNEYIFMKASFPKRIETSDDSGMY